MKLPELNARELGEDVWAVVKHGFNDEVSGLRLEFTFDDYGSPMLKIYTAMRDKVLRILFDPCGIVAAVDVRPYPDVHMQQASNGAGSTPHHTYALNSSEQ